MVMDIPKVMLITGGSRGIGAALAHRGDCFGYMEWNHELLSQKLRGESWRDA